METLFTASDPFHYATFPSAFQHFKFKALVNWQEDIATAFDSLDRNVIH
jgi:hypothetical protein